MAQSCCSVRQRFRLCSGRRARRCPTPPHYLTALAPRPAADHAIFIGRVSWVGGTANPSFLAQLNHHHWIGRMLGIRGGEIVVMQGLRNSLLAATFVGVLAFTAASEALQRVADARGGGGGGALSPAEVRNLVLGVVYSCSFLNFCLAGKRRPADTASTRARAPPCPPPRAHAACPRQ